MVIFSTTQVEIRTYDRWCHTQALVQSATATGLKVKCDQLGYNLTQHQPAIQSVNHLPLHRVSFVLMDI